MMTCDESDLRGRKLTAEGQDDQKVLFDRLRELQKQKAAMALDTFQGDGLGAFQGGVLGRED